VQSKHAEIKPFICETCGKGFGTKPGLKLHLQKHKISFIGKEWPCDICGKVYDFEYCCCQLLTNVRLVVDCSPALG
jgi:Zinc finger, C2H2 type